MVFKVINTFKNHYINPFDAFLEKDTLYSSGAAMPAEFNDYLLSLHEHRKQQKSFTIRSREITTKCF